MTTLIVILKRRVVNMKKQFGEYYLGLDIGTDSIGWAVSDLEYNLQRFHGKDMWGIRLFEGGKTAEERRLFRSTRRRIQRQHQRIKFLQEIFADEINKVDNKFYQRLVDSKFFPEDKTEDQRNTLFNDKNFSDKDYHEKYPTIFHLRKALIDGGEKIDIRLIYLGLHHIMKNRGHFLFAGQNLENVESFSNAFNALNTYLDDEFGFSFADANLNIVAETLKNGQMGVKDKSKKLNDLFGATSKQMKDMVTLLCGGTASIKNILNLENIDLDTEKLCFKTVEYDSFRDTLLDIIGDLDKVECIDRLKSVYDWALLAEIKHGEKFLSYAKVVAYNKHKEDIKKLKEVMRKYSDKSTYNKMFNDVSEKNNYVSYVGMTKKVGKKQVVTVKKCTSVDFCKYVKSVLSKLKVEDDGIKAIVLECDNGTLAPKEITRDNGVIPYQMHLLELRRILENASKYYPFLKVKDASGFSASEKIEKILTFRIPYYVGPLNDSHKIGDGIEGNCWIVKNNDEKITPWNFDQVVNKKACAEKFIRRMTNKCTYINNADVLPRNSLLYSKFTVLNELNNVCINGTRLPVDLKQHIYRELFMTHKKVSGKLFKNFMINNGYISEEDVLSGFDIDFKSSLQSYIDFSGIIGSKVNDTLMIDTIINWIVIFGESKELLAERINNSFGDKLTVSEIKNILRLKYTGWGTMSREFLQDIVSPMPGFADSLSIIRALWDTSNNLMELLGGEYQFSADLKKYNLANATDITGGITYDQVKDLYVSPAVKRGLWQTLQITEEIKGIMGREPKKVFIEMTRGVGQKKRTVSRKNLLIDLYKKCKDETRDWVGELGQHSDADLRSDKLYLYYTQMSRCMYTNTIIRLDDLFKVGKDGKALYDIEHIYPQSKTKDDSLDNRVLVKAEANRSKGDKYPVPQEYRAKSISLWKELLDKGFISRKKYDRLVRNSPLTEDELAGFIARQIVETSQSTKAAAEILQREYTNSEIVYVKAGNVSSFRQQYDFIKCRDINDYHHAKDAYLNIIVGNVYNTKFTHSPINFIKNRDNRYSLNRMYDFPVERGGVVAWRTGEDGSIATVSKTMNTNRVLFTRYATVAHGGLFDQMPMKAGKGQMPLKSGKNTPLVNIDKYGGYNKVAGAYFFLVEHLLKEKVVRTIEYVPITIANSMHDDDSLLEYCETVLGLKEARILLPKIKINSLFKVDGFKMHISGRTGDRIIFKGANQLVLDKNEEKYIKNISKFIARNKEAKGKLSITEFDKLDCIENLKLYDAFFKKIETTLYKIRLSAQVENLKNGREIFVKLLVEEQVNVLYEVLHMFQCNSYSSNLTSIGGSGKAALLKIGKNITGINKIFIVNQSLTGLFEKEVDLLKL